MFFLKSDNKCWKHGVLSENCQRDMINGTKETILIKVEEKHNAVLNYTALDKQTQWIISWLAKYWTQGKMWKMHKRNLFQRATWIGVTVVDEKHPEMKEVCVWTIHVSDLQGSPSHADSERYS